MSALSDLERRLGELRRELDDVRIESRANVGTLATAIRKTRNQVDDALLRNSVRRGRPSSATQMWDPRIGEFEAPDLASSLISRLRRGDTVSNTLGETQSGGAGLRNLLQDARLGSGSTTSTSLIGGALARVTLDWSAILAAGATGLGVCEVRRNFGYDNPTNNPLQTATLGVDMENWSAAGSATVKFKVLIPQTAFDPTLLPFCVFSVTFFKSTQFTQAFLNATTVPITLIIRDGADTTDLAVSPPLEFLDMGLGEYMRWWVAVPSSELAADDLTLVINVGLTTSGSSGGAGNGNFTVDFGDPQFELAPYQAPSAFQPEPTAAVGRIYLPAGSAYGINIKRYDDTGLSYQGRLVLGMSASDEGQIEWGSGSTSRDVRLRRSAAGVLTLDNGAAAAASLGIQGGTDQGTLLHFATDRPWQFEQDGTGAATALVLRSINDTKQFKIKSTDKSKTPLVVVADNAGGAVTVGDSYRHSGVISPAQITANTDNYAPTGLHNTSVLRINSDAARNLTGIGAGADGERILLINTGAFTITLVHDATSTAANRFLCPGSANYALTANASVYIWYDTVSDRWRVIG